MILLLILSTFTFQTAGADMQGYLALPSHPPKALLIYFHRYVEKGDAVNLWGESLNSRGYAVAGFTAPRSGNILEVTENALLSLRKNPALQNVPVIAMGASMGTLTAAQWFASSSRVRALILIVPGSPDICSFLKASAGRPVYLIQAENDETTHGSGAKIRQCVTPGKPFLLKGAGHLFPPSSVANEISQWLDSIPLATE
jgi:hypothetical protein